MSTRRRHRGFTLLELVLVLLVLAIALAVAAPSFRGFWSGLQGRDAAFQIVSLTRWARAQAAADGRIYRLNFDVAQRRYWLTVQEGEQFVELKTDLGRPVLLPDGIELELVVESVDAPRDYIEFRPNGRTQAATIRLIEQGRQPIEIVCRSPTEQFELLRQPGGA